MNKIIITGRLTKDPELNSTNSGMEVCNFTVAVDRRVKQGAEKMADFIECTAWGKSGVFVSTYFHKGDGINVEGRMESRKWTDKDGHNRVSWGVTCENVEFPHGKSKGSQSEPYEATQHVPFDMEEVGSPVNVTVDEADGLPF